MVNRNALKKKYGEERVFVVPIQAVQHIEDKFQYDKNSKNIWSRYDNLGKYVLRYEAEYEPSMQQIIPYFFVLNEDMSKIFVAKRLQGDKRLVDKISLGFGGHIDSCDGSHEIILKALAREMHEELDIEPITKANYLGTIRDITSETNDHFGLVFYVLAREGEVKINETENLEGHWMTIEEAIEEYGKFENWSKYILDFLFENKMKL